MDIDEFLKGGNITKNPEYNPKTKKGRQEPPLLKDYNIGTSISDMLRKNISSNVAKSTYFLDTDKLEKDAENNVYLNPYNTEEELQLERANNQSAFEQTGNALVQAGLNEVLIGTALGISNLVDMGININKEKGEDNYTNPFSTYLESIQNDIRNRFEIYQKDPNAHWAIGDFGWWANNAVSIASSASMLIPSTGIVKGLGALGKVLGAGKISRGIAKAAKGTKNATRLEKAINSGTEIGTTTLLSRTMENYLEARGVYNELYDDTLNKVKSMSTEEKETLIKNNPQFINKTDEEIAKYISSVSADETFRNDFAMLLFDIPQFKAISSLWKGTAKKAATAATRIKNRNTIKSLLGDSGEKTLEKTGWLANRKEAIKHSLNHPLTSIGAVEWTEGIEEGYQGIQTEKGKEVAAKILDPSFNERTLNSYLNDPAIWEQAFWGVLGGIGFQAIGTGVGNLYEKARGKWNKKHMSEEDYAKSQLTDEKIRGIEIDNRKSRMQNYVEAMQLLNSGKNPFRYKIDTVTKQPIVEDGNKVNESVTTEEAEDLKAQLTNDFVTEMVLDATDVGNYELFKEFVTSEEFNKFFEEAGVNQTVGDKTLSQQLVETMDDVYSKYTTALYDILNSVDVTNESVAKLEARSITKRKLKIDSINDSINRVDEEISRLSDDVTIDNNYLESERVKYVRKQLKALDKAETELREQLNNKTLTQQAFDQYKKDYDIRRNQLLDYAARNTNFGALEKIKEDIKTTIGDRNADSFIAKFETFYDDLSNKFPELFGIIDNKNLPKKTVQDAIKKKINLEDNLSYTENTLPKTQQEYKNEYDEISRNVDKLVIERYENASDKVSKWIEQQEDLDKAIDDIMTNNVPDDLKESLDILKIGHPTTAKYVQSINQVINLARKDRKKKADEARVVRTDDEKLTETKAVEKKEEIKEVIDKTDKRESERETPPSTGKETKATTTKVNPETVVAVPKKEVIAEIEKADKAVETIIKTQAETINLNIDERAIGLGSSITFNLFKNSRNLFDDALGKDINSEEVQKIIDIVSDELETQGVSRGYCRQAAINGVKLALNTIYRRLKSKNMSNADKFKHLADEIATKSRIQRNDDGMNAVTSTIPDTEIDKVIEEFLDAYVEYKGIDTVRGQSVIINIENLFNELITNKEIGVEQAKYIFYNIADYINNPYNEKYIFTAKNTLNKSLKNPSIFFNTINEHKAQTEVVDSYMHINAPTITNKKYEKMLDEIENGAEVTVEYGVDRNGDPVDTSISIYYDGEEVGYIATVDKSRTNDEFYIRKQKKGFAYRVKKLPTGEIQTNLDYLFEGIINRSDDNFDFIWELANKKYRLDIAPFIPGVTEEISINETEKFLKTPAIKEAIEKGLILYPKHWVVDNGRIGHWENDLVTAKQKANFILDYINNILFFDNSAETKADRLASYSYWKTNLFTNYSNTHKIQLALEENKKVPTRLVGMSSRTSIITEESRNISDLGFTYDTNPIMAVISNNNTSYIVNEQTGATYDNVAGFMPGTMGVLIQDNPKAPIIATFTEANKLSDNKELSKDVETEISNLLIKFQSGEITFNEISDALSDLFSGPGVETNNLFSGYSVVRSNDATLLNIQGKKGEYSLIIHRYKKDTNEEGTGITYMPNGDISKAKSSINVDKGFISKIAKEIVNNLTFNKTFYAIKNNKKDKDKTNRYIYKENGKLIIEIGGNKKSYNSFGHFVLANNAFKTNQGRNSNGGYFDIKDKVNSLYIDTAITNLPVEGEVKSVSDTIKSATTTKANSTEELLKLANVEQSKIDVLTGKNEFDIKLLPENYYYDAKLTFANAKHKNGKIYFSPRGATAAQKSNNTLIRLLLHENLHAQFNTHNIFAREGLVDDLFDTYNAFVEAIEYDLANADKESINYKLALQAKKWIENNKFDPVNYFTNASKKQQEVWANKTEEERRQIFAEEWLVESMTQSGIMQYLNNTIYKKEEISIEGIDNSNKTIWQKIIDILLKLFGKNTDNVNKNTILAKQYIILGNTTTNINTSTENVEAITEKNEDVVEPIKDPISTEVSDVESVDENKEQQDTSINKEHSITDYTVQEEQVEEINIDDIDDFAITSDIQSIDETRIDSYNANKEVNPNGLNTINDMNDYINTFDEQDKPLIADMMATGQIKFVCR